MSSSSPALTEKFEEKELHILKCAIQFLFRHIRFDESTVTRMSDNQVFHLFDEYVYFFARGLISVLFRRQYHFSKKDKLDQVLIDSVYETTETHIATFILAIMHQGLFSVPSLVIAIIYLSRFKEATRVSLHTYTWRLLFLAALLIADKANEDKPIKNGSLVRLFPIVTAEELAKLEAAMLTKMRFSIFIKSELFYSFMDKLLIESVSVEINAIVSNSDFATQQLLPSMRTVPCTPEPLIQASSIGASKTSLRRSDPILITPSTSRSRSQQPQVFIQNLMESTGVTKSSSPIVIKPADFPDLSTVSQRGRSRSVSRRRSPSSSFMDDNSLEYSRTSSRRHSSTRAVHVPPPPVFEPVKYQGHPRRLSIGRSPKESPSGFNSNIARAPSPGCRTFVNIQSNNRHHSANHRWNNLF